MKKLSFLSLAAMALLAAGCASGPAPADKQASSEAPCHSTAGTGSIVVRRSDCGAAAANVNSMDTEEARRGAAAMQQPTMLKP